MSIGEKICTLRKENGWSQDELAEKIGGNGRHISRYENNKTVPSAEVIIRLAKALNVNIDYLLIDNVPRQAYGNPHDEVIEKVKSAGEFSTDDKKALIHFIDAIIAKNKLKSLASEIR
jgi:transcriptional regulator with XRE-family HTH domain